MNLLLPPSLTDKDRIESRLLMLAAIFLFLFCTALSLSSAVRLHSWAVPYRTGHWAGICHLAGGIPIVASAVMQVIA